MYPKFLTLGCLLLSSPAIATFSGYTYETPLYIQNAKVPNTDQLNFPVLVSTTNANIKTVANSGHVSNASGYDIVFSTNSDCSFILKWDTETYNASSGNLIAWVNLPTVFTASNTTFYMCYGNSSVTSYMGVSTGTWDSNFKFVAHLGDGTTLGPNDSTVSAILGTNHSATATTGQIDGAGNFVAASSQYIEYGSPAATQITNNLTMEAWFTSGDSAVKSILNNQFRAGTTKGVIFLLNNTGPTYNFFFGNGSATSELDFAGTFNDGVLHHVAFTFASGTVTGYLDGVAASPQTSALTVIGYGAEGMRIGANAALNTFHTGKVDEARISNVVRSADWIATEYNNESAPNIFIVAGAESTSGGAVVPVGTLLHGMEF